MIDKGEIVKIITAIKIQCPEGLQAKTQEELSLLVNLWYESLKEYPKEVVWTGVRNALKNTVYQKQNWLGAICVEIKKIADSFDRNGVELWEELRRVLFRISDDVFLAYSNATFVEENGKQQRHNAYDRIVEVYNAMEELLKKYVCTVGRLIQLSRMEERDLEIERARFLKAIPEMIEKDKVQKSLPKNILQMASKNSLRLEEHND